MENDREQHSEISLALSPVALFLVALFLVDRLLARWLAHVIFLCTCSLISAQLSVAAFVPAVY